MTENWIDQWLHGDQSSGGERSGREGFKRGLWKLFGQNRYYLDLGNGFILPTYFKSYPSLYFKYVQLIIC